MAVSFSQIPSDVRVPGTYNEVDDTQAEQGAGTFPLRGLILAEKNNTGGGYAGSLLVNTPTRITSAAEASEYAGQGSPAARMAAAWFSVNARSELWLCGVSPTGTAATKTVTFTGTSAGGSVAFYVGGDRYSIDASGAVGTIASNLVAAITANPEAPVTASAAAGVVTLTAKANGAGGNYIDVRHSHLAGERLPVGLSVAIAAGVTATGAPDFATALANMGSTQFDVIATASHQAAALAQIETELASRADALTALPGIAFTGIHGSVANLVTTGSSRNSEFSTIVGMESFPGVAYERAAAIAGLVALHGSTDPARPFQNLTLPGYAPAESARFTDAERELLLHDGIATTKSELGTTKIERLITTYQTNAAGAPSSSYLDVNTMLTLSYLRKSWVARVASRFPRHKLAADGGTPPAPGSALVTPKSYQGEAVAWYAELVEAGICEDEQGFAQNSTFEINASDPNRLDVVLAPNLVNQNRVTATLVQFRL